MKRSLLLVGLVLAVLGLVTLGLYFSYGNREVDLRGNFAAKKQDVEATRDKMYKVLTEKGGLVTDYRDFAERLFPQIVAGRYTASGNGDGSLMKMVTEQNPAFDVSLYRDLSQSIEAERSEFLERQRLAVDAQRAYNTFVNKAPNRYFLGPIDSLHYTVLSSGKTKEIMRTGVDDETLVLSKPAGKGDSTRRR